MVIFKSNQKKFEGDLKIKLCGKRLGVKIDTTLSWYHVNDLSIKLNRANALLFKMRKYVAAMVRCSRFIRITNSSDTNSTDSSHWNL